MVTNGGTDMNLDELYNTFHEEERLFHGYASQVEYLTTLHYIYTYAKPSMRILEIGAGCGAYSLRLAEEGFHITAMDTVKRHIEIMKAKKRKDTDITIIQGNILDLPQAWNEVFDMVLCLGPLYHIEDNQQQFTAIANCCRLCKKQGILMFSYIPHDMVIASETFHVPNFLLSEELCQESLQLKNNPFIFHDEQQIEALFQTFPLRKEKHLAADGLAELMRERIDRFSKQEFEIYMKYHLHTCEKPSFLGHSNHNLLIFSKTD